MTVPAGPGRFGPVDPENFFTAQRRHRRRARALAVWAGVAAIGQSGLAALMFAPLTFVVLTLALDAAYLLGAHSPDSYALLRTAPGTTVLGLVLIGVAALFVLWLLLGRSLRGGLVGAALTAGARPPDDDDPHEHELCNVVAEMSLAAGVRPPRVVMLDGPGMNLAVHGAARQEGTLVVPRSLLIEVDRRRTQALVAHQISSIANGDLAVLNRVQALPLAWAVPARLMAYPLRAGTWRMWARSVQLVAGRLDSLAEAALVEEILTRTAREVEGDAGRNAFLTFPAMVVSGSFSAMRLVADLAVVGPLVRVWVKRRRYLADAMAVQLTRDPGQLAAALIQLTERGGRLPGAGSVDLAAVLAVGQEHAEPGAPGAPPEGTIRPRGGAGATSSPLGQLAVGWHPSMAQRLRRLQALGYRPAEASAEAVPPPSVRHDLRHHPLRSIAALLVFVPLYAVVAVLLLVLAVMMLAFCIWPIMIFYGLPLYVLLLPVHEAIRR